MFTLARKHATRFCIRRGWARDAERGNEGLAATRRFFGGSLRNFSWRLFVVWRLGVPFVASAWRGGAEALVPEEVFLLLVEDADGGGEVVEP